MPYLKNGPVFACPSDSGPTPSPDSNGTLDTTRAYTIPRSYIASTAIESLSDAQISHPTDTIVITEKWDKSLATGAAITETFMDAFDGDMSPDPLNPARMVKIASRHQGGMNAAFYDGHAKWLTPGAIWQSRDLTGCSLIHKYPTPRACDISFPGCASTGNGNLCNNPAFFPYPTD